MMAAGDASLPLVKATKMPAIVLRKLPETWTAKKPTRTKIRIAINGAAMGSTRTAISTRRTGRITGSVRRLTVMADQLNGLTSRYLKRERSKIKTIAATMMAVAP